VLADAIHIVVFMKKLEGIRRVAEIVSVGFSSQANDYAFDYQYRFEKESAHPYDGELLAA